jgi:hypothetical protein
VRRKKEKRLAKNRKSGVDTVPEDTHLIIEHLGDDIPLHFISGLRPHVVLLVEPYLAAKTTFSHVW